MSLRPANSWVPQAAGLVAAAAISILIPPVHPKAWLPLLLSSVFVILRTSLTCAAVMFGVYVMLPPRLDPGSVVRRTSAIAACLAPLTFFLAQDSLWAPLATAFLVWTLLPAQVTPKPEWKKFAVAFVAAILLQIGAAAAMGEDGRIAALALGIAAAPVLWRIRQERPLRGAFEPIWILAIALLLAILSLTAYLPRRLGGGYIEAAGRPGIGKPATGENRGISMGGKYRGVILMPEDEQNVILVPPLPMMGRDLFAAHQDPISIPFYGVYWLFQSPDKRPLDDAYRTKGSPDKITFRSADRTPLNMEAHQNLGRLIDVKSLSRIDIVVRNADFYGGAVALELYISNTSENGHPRQWLGEAQLVSRPGMNETMQETLSFKIPPASAIQQFDELTIRFPRAPFRSNRSARTAIERFFLVPRGR